MCEKRTPCSQVSCRDGAKGDFLCYQIDILIDLSKTPEDSLKRGKLGPQPASFEAPLAPRAKPAQMVQKGKADLGQSIIRAADDVFARFSPSGSYSRLLARARRGTLTLDALQLVLSSNRDRRRIPSLADEDQLAD
jgi:hypothetical protein